MGKYISPRIGILESPRKVPEWAIIKRRGQLSGRKARIRHSREGQSERWEIDEVAGGYLDTDGNKRATTWTEGWRQVTPNPKEKGATRVESYFPKEFGEGSKRLVGGEDQIDGSPSNHLYRKTSFIRGGSRQRRGIPDQAVFPSTETQGIQGNCSVLEAAGGRTFNLSSGKKQTDEGI